MGIQVSSLSNVINCGACTGCGVCSVFSGGRIPIKIDDYGVWQADLSQAMVQDQDLGSQVCPFADESPNETAIASELFPSLPMDSQIGRYHEVLAVQVADSDFVANSSSGGLTTWLLKQLLERQLIDGVIHVGAQSGDRLFSYQVSHSVPELLSRRKSIYYSTSMAGPLTEIKGNGKKYALVGVPCFITAGRLLTRRDEELQEQLAFFIGLVCGHLKSPGFAELLAWQVGVPPHELSAVDFRVKNPEKDAAHYDFEAVSLDGVARRAATSSLLGGDWGLGLFQLDACNYCDDVFAETADVALGDAWLPEFTADWRGHNVVVTRHPTLASVIREGDALGDLAVQPLDVEQASRSQAGNMRHRRDGLALRLHDDQSRGRWTPRKRVPPSEDLPSQRKAVVRARRRLSSQSLKLFEDAKESGSLDPFIKGITPCIETYKRAYHVSAARRALRRLRRGAGRVVGFVRRS